MFVEKPAAVDVAGMHQLLEADELAKKNGTGVLAGLTYRYHLGRREAVERMHNGEIGEIVAIQCDFLRAPYGLVARQPGWSEMEYQFRNWYHFTWLSGDDVPQSLIHNLDSALWAVHDESPVSVYGLGGRSSEFQPEMGTSFDHHSVIYEFANGRKIYGSVRTAVGCFGNNIDVFHGTKGRCIFAAFAPPKFTDLTGKVTWKADEEASKKSPYRQEHMEFLQSIREGRPFQRGKQLAMSTLGYRARPDGRLHRPADHVGRRTELEVRLPTRRRGAAGHGAARKTRPRRPLPDRQTGRHKTDLK